MKLPPRWVFTAIGLVDIGIGGYLVAICPGLFGYFVAISGLICMAFRPE